MSLLHLSAGLLLGFFYFGSLWLTVQSLVKVKRPAMLSIGSFFFRTGLTLGGFFHSYVRTMGTSLCLYVWFSCDAKGTYTPLWVCTPGPSNEKGIDYGDIASRPDKP